MIVHEQWTDQLSDYLDGELSAEERKAVDAHLEGCAECTAVLNDLKRVVTRAASMPPRPPQADLWDGIAARIETDASRSRDAVLPFARRESRRFTFTLPQLAAAAALLIAVSGGAAWEVARRAAECRRLAPGRFRGAGRGEPGRPGFIGRWRRPSSPRLQRAPGLRTSPGSKR